MPFQPAYHKTAGTPHPLKLEDVQVNISVPLRAIPLKLTSPTHLVHRTCVCHNAHAYSVLLRTAQLQSWVPYKLLPETLTTHISVPLNAIPPKFGTCEAPFTDDATALRPHTYRKTSVTPNPVKSRH